MAEGSDSGQAVTSHVPGGALPPGTLLNGIYRIEERLGAGGMGEVYRATNIANDDQDAIKIIGRGMANQTVVEAMFRKEARVLRRIQSPAVAQLRLFARDPALDVLYFVTEFVAGVSLLDRLRRSPASAEELRALMARMCIGLQAVHDAGAIHRDLSPDNIILPDGDVTQAKIIDFGIVKELDPAQVSMIGDGFAGKFGYIAPEQLGFTGSRIGPWTDLYALALVGLAFAGGKAVYMGATMGTADEARRRPVDLDPLPPELRPVFARMLTYDWRERVSSASAVLAMLDVADGETMMMMAPPPPPPPPPPPEPPVQWGQPAVPPPVSQPQAGGYPAPSPPYHSQPPHAAQPYGAYPAHGGYPPPQPGYPAQDHAPQHFAGVPHEHSHPPGTGERRGARWPIFVGIAALLVLVAAATWWWMAPPPFAVPGVPMRDTGSGLQYQILAPGAGGVRPSPGDTVILRVRQRVPGEVAPGAGQVVVDQLRPERMWVGQIEAVRLMTRGQRLLVWVPPDLRGTTESGVDTTAAGKRAVLDIELIDFGRADAPALRARIEELGQQPPAVTPSPTPTPTPAATAVPTIDTIVVPTTAPTPPITQAELAPTPTPTPRAVPVPRRPVPETPAERSSPREQPRESSPSEDSARKGA